MREVTDLPTASIVIPTHGRPQYLDVTLASIAPQAERVGAEVIVVSDGRDTASATVAEGHGARLITLPQPAGANAARNAAVRQARGDPIVFIDDDIDAPPGWLDALLAGVAGAPYRDVFGGPIRARLEGGGPRACGREPAPITTLDYGSEDRDVALVWSANMAIRRRALDQIGRFDETISIRGDEEDWQRRYAARGGRVRYVANAGLHHRRSAVDATLRRLAVSAYRQGRASRRYDMHKGTAPSIPGELRTLLGCVWHVFRRRCANGIVLSAQAAGRLHETLAERRAEREAHRRAGPEPPSANGPDDFLSGTSGHVYGIRPTTEAIVADAVCDAVGFARLQPGGLRRAARAWPQRRVLALGIERTDRPNLLASTRAELLRSRHEVRFASAAAADRGKFENLNLLLEANPAQGHDWLVVVDDDVELPAGFLDTFIFLAERFGLRLAQPAHRRLSHAAFDITRRRATTVARETAFVEIGPVFAFSAVTFDVLLPFPPLRIGWGLDAHWSAVAQQHEWPIGVIDATPIRHGLRRIAASYDRRAAVAEAREFLAERPYTTAREAQRTLAAHRSWR
jgi:GT2 family glycosyltransferase